MHKETKVRAWDEQQKIMHHDFQFIKSGDSGNDWIIFTSDKQTLSDKPHPFDNSYFSQQLKRMEYIGRKDKNGKEVFDGDILNYGEPYNQYVRWQPTINGWAMGFLKGGTTDIPNEFEVVGNIYENPELLKR